MQFVVRAHNSAGWGPWSGPSAPVTPDIEPGRPAAPSVQFADGALLVSWSPPANEGSAITAYDLQIGGGASAIQRVGTTTTFRWEGLTNGQEYTFMVRAVNAKGEGQFSSASAPEHPLRPPDAPAAPVGERGDKTINVRWSPPGNGGDPVIEYEVQILSTGAVNRTTGTSLQWANLPNGQPQQFQVRARNRGGWGPSSAASAAVVPCGVPDRTGGVSAQRADGAATVSWAAPGNQGCAITGYTISTNHGQSMNVGGGSTSATFGGLANGTSYTFTVAAVNEVGPGAASAPSNAVTPAGPPCAPQIIGGHPGHGSGDGHVDRRLQQRQRHHHVPAVRQRRWLGERRHRHCRRTAPGWPTARRTRSRCAPSTTSAPAPAATPSRPARPASRPRSAGSTSAAGRRQIAASWSAPNDNGKPITRYEVDIAAGRHRRRRDRPLAHVHRARRVQHAYDVRVRACNEVGCGAWSATRRTARHRRPAGRSP